MYDHTLMKARINSFKNTPGGFHVAVKEFKNDKGKESFIREKDNLIAIRTLKNPHLIQHIATCEIENASRSDSRRSSSSSSYYIIFPLADGGTLLDYWMNENRIPFNIQDHEDESTSDSGVDLSPVREEMYDTSMKLKLEEKVPRNKELVVWSIEQMLGIANAVDSLHHGLGGTVNCRHGDIKPANILLFKENEDDKGQLKIADLGVSRVHKDSTDKRRDGTTTNATTVSYEAPEAHRRSDSKDKPRPRTYDMWSLGCVFLEFTIWILYGYPAICHFENNRYRNNGSEETRYYRLDSNKAVVSPTVLEALQDLRRDSRCMSGTALGDLVDFIETRLLVISVDPQDLHRRCEAGELTKKLKTILEKAETQQNPLDPRQDNTISEIFSKSRFRP